MEVVLSLTSLSFLNLFLKSLSSKTSFIWSEFLFWSLIWDFGLEVSLGVGGFKFSSVPGAVPVSLSLSFFFFFIYLFLAALGLHCCTWAFNWGCSPLRYTRLLIAVAPLLQSTGSRCVGSSSRWCTGLVAPQHGGSSQPRTPVPCIGRWILNHRTTWEVLSLCLEALPLPPPWEPGLTWPHFLQSS